MHTLDFDGARRYVDVVIYVDLFTGTKDLGDMKSIDIRVGIRSGANSLIGFRFVPLSTVGNVKKSGKHCH